MSEPITPPPGDPTDTPTPATPPTDATTALGYQSPTDAKAYTGPAPDKDSKTMAMLAHLLGILLGFLGPLIIWLMKKEQSPFIDDQGKEALNFQLVLLIGYVIGGATTFVCVGFIILPIVWVAGLIFGIMGTMKANEGIAYRYPFNIRFIK